METKEKKKRTPRKPKEDKKQTLVIKKGAQYIIGEYDVNIMDVHYNATLNKVYVRLVYYIYIGIDPKYTLERRQVTMQAADFEKFCGGKLYNYCYITNEKEVQE